jgi:hypothetical protein
MKTKTTLTSLVFALALTFTTYAAASNTPTSTEQNSDNPITQCNQLNANSFTGR